jgi:hypothetical protein
MAINPGPYDLKIQRRADFKQQLGFKNNVEVKTSSVNLSTDVITITDHGFVNNQAIQYIANDVEVIGGLTDKTTYYVRDKTDDTFKLAAYVGGSAIDLTSQGNSKQTFKADTNLTGFLVVSQIWDIERTQKFLDFSVTYTTPASGLITLSLTSTQTTTLTGGEYRYDVLLNDGTATKEYYLEGVVYVSQGYSAS